MFTRLGYMIGIRKLKSDNTKTSELQSTESIL